MLCLRKIIVFFFYQKIVKKKSPLKASGHVVFKENFPPNVKTICS